VKIDHINVGSIDFGIGVLRGVLGSDVRSRLSDALVADVERSIVNMRAAARIVERMQQSEKLPAMNPHSIPCRMCQAAPGEPCKYKGAPIERAIGGHSPRTRECYRRYHYKRVADARLVRAAKERE
jgi:hypothetical protein